MRAVLQRVSHAKVVVGHVTSGEIANGLVVFVAIGADDALDHARTLAEKIANLRIFDDESGKMNRSLLDVRGEVLVVSEFTLYGDCRKGRRPNYVRAARPEKARQLYVALVDSLRAIGVKVATGEFQAMMRVELVNEGPVTLLLNTERTL